MSDVYAQPYHYYPKPLAVVHSSIVHRTRVSGLRAVLLNDDLPKVSCDNGFQFTIFILTRGI